MSQHPCAPIDEPAGGGSTSDRLADQGHALAEKARETGERVKSAASDATMRARERIERLATERKEQAARRIGNYGSAIHDSARSLEEQDPNIAWFTHRCADRLDQIADYVRTHNFTALRNDVEDVARRHPGAFFGGIFLFGLVLGNMAKASRRNLSRETDDFTGDQLSDWRRPEPGTAFRPTEENPTAAPTGGI